MLPVVLLAMFMAGFDIWVVNVALVFFFGRFMFVLTLLLQAGLHPGHLRGHLPLMAGVSVHDDGVVTSR